MKKGKKSALFSHYVIDGARKEMTPAQMLEECMNGGRLVPDLDDQSESFEDILDESVDPEIHTSSDCPTNLEDCLNKVYFARESNDPVSHHTESRLMKLAVAQALVDSVWNPELGLLPNLSLQLDWEWNEEPMGAFASFHSGVSALTSYLFDLNVSVAGASYTPAPHDRLNVKVLPAADAICDESLDCINLLDDCSTCDCSVSDCSASFIPSDERNKSHPSDEGNKFHPSDERNKYHHFHDEMEASTPTDNHSPLAMDPSSWLVYVPFDTAVCHLGGSLYCDVIGSTGEPVQDLSDPCYFADCFEVVKEIVHDGVALAGVTVGRGGLLTAMKELCSRGDNPVGVQVNIAGILSLNSELDARSVLFSELPGVIIQVADSDIDYIDSQFLLQDVAYFPLGHPDFTSTNISVRQDGKTGIAVILDSLLGSQTAEGED